MDLLYDIPPLIGFGLSIILAALVLRQRPRSRLHQVFSLFLISLGLWAFTIFGMRVSPTLEQALPWEKAIFVVLPLVSVSFYHFVTLFTRSRGKGWRLLLAYSSLVLVAAIAPTDLLVIRMREMWYGHGFIPGPLLPVYMLVYYGIVIIALLHVAKAYRLSESSLERTRYLYVAIGVTFTLVGIFVDVLAAGGVRIYPMGIPSNILFSLLCTYAILKYHLLDIRVVVRKGTAYVLVSTLAIGLYLGLVFVTYLFVTHAWSLPFWFNVAFILFIAIGLQPTLRWAQGIVDRWFYRGRQDYLYALESLSDETKAIVDLEYIAQSLVSTTAVAMQCKSVSVLLPDAEEKSFVPVASQGLSQDSSIHIDQNSALIWWLSQREDMVTRQEIDITPQLQALTARERAMLDKLEAELFVPMMTREGLRGIMILGRKLSEQDYSLEEGRMLRVVARQMAATLDNARLYELQMRRYQEQVLLSKLGMTVSSELDLEKVYSHFIDELKQVLTIDFAGINLVNRGDEFSVDTVVLSPLSGRGLVWDATGEFSGAGATEDSSQTFHYLPDLSRGVGFQRDEQFRRVGISSLLRLPLRSEGGLLGNFLLASREPDAYSADDIRLLQQVATQLAIAIDKSRLYESERQARLELEKQDRERTEFINSLIHEIKTPITAMLASSELLREELPADASSLGELAENLDISVNNLNRRVSELTDFVKLRRVEPVLNMQSVNVEQVVKSVASQVAGLLQSRNQTLNLELPPSLAPAQADPDRVVQVLLNLLTNASKFSQPDTKIWLRAHSVNGEVVLEVHDSGLPIGAEEAKQVFNAYYRGKRGGVGGLGLGLFICKKLVQLHGGRIWVETNKSGNSFKFSLPATSNSGGETT
ncbi:MAG: GAF domain-containing protein [Chloroflexi bacterium]|nr:GAF domain-containing protein [Chloroflexota bacterium]